MIAPATPTSPPLGSPEQLCAELDHWLRNHQGMFGNRLAVYRNVMRRIINPRFGELLEQVDAFLSAN